MTTDTGHAPPLTIRVTPVSPRTVVGQGILLQVAHRVRASLEMETVELNQSRTRISVVCTSDPGREPEVLTGLDHMQLYRVPARQEIGRRFTAAPESRWESLLELLLHRRPLPVGRYQISVEYRHGDGQQDTARAEPLELEVVPADLSWTSSAWYGASDPRQELESLWSAGAGPEARLYYQRAAGHDPGVVSVSVDLGPPPAGALCTPRLAQLNDLSAMHFERYAVWLEGAGLTWMTVQPRGPIRGPEVVPHGLAATPTPVLLGPPLHLRSGGLAAVIVGYDSGGAPSASLVEVQPDGASRQLLLPLGPDLPDHAAVAWGAQEDPLSGAIFGVNTDRQSSSSRFFRLDLGSGQQEPLHSTNDRLEALGLDQWLGLGAAVALVRGKAGPELLSWDVEPASPGTIYKALGLPAGEALPPGPPKQMALYSGGQHVALLYLLEDGWRVLGPGGAQTLSFDRVPAEPPPHLVATRGGALYLVTHHRERGFEALPMEKAPGGAC